MMFRLSFMMLVAVCLLVAIDVQAFAGCKRCGKRAGARHLTGETCAAAEPSTSKAIPAAVVQPTTATVPEVQQAAAVQPTSLAPDCRDGVCPAAAPHVPAARILAKFRR